MMDEEFLPFVLIIIVPLAYVAGRIGLFSTRPLRWATGLFLIALVLLRFPVDGIGYFFLKRLNLLLTAIVAGVLVLRWLEVPWLLRARNYRIVLALTALVAVTSYTNFFSFHGARSYVHLHDVAHYYLGSKYFDELGYRNLYRAMVRAEAEEYGYSRTPEARDLAGNFLVPVGQLLEESAAVRERFSDARWADFRKDVRYFRDRMGETYAEVIRDHGYNPTPAWSLIGGFLANRVPAGSPTGILLLTLLDPVLLAAAFGSVALTFGLEAALLSLVYFCLAFGAMYTWTGGGFLRELSFSAMILSACLLQTRRYGLAGGALAIAAVLRIFPALLAAGVIFREVAELASRRAFRGAVRYVGGLVAVGGILVLLSCIRADGPDRWREFAANISGHMQSASSNLIGVTGWLAYGGEAADGEGIDQLIARREKVRRIQLVTIFPIALALVLLIAPGMEAIGAMAAGSVLVLTGLNLSAYYYAFLVLLVLAFRDRPRDLALIFSVEVLVYAAHLFEQHEVMLYLYKSLLLVFLMIALYVEPARVAAAKVVGRFRRRAEAPEGAARVRRSAAGR